MIWTMAFAGAIVALDQITKILSVEFLTGLEGYSYPVWEGVLHLAYVENRGAAFGMMQGGRWFFLLITFAACILIIWYLFRERRRMHALMKLSLSLVLGGAVGNLIDRVLLGYVRDMIYVRLIDFPVFNVADMAVCIGCGLLILDILFFKGKTYFDAPKAAEEPGDAAEEAHSGAEDGAGGE